ncbi:MAG: hypothetical protein RL701_1789 [Pseudomonadota bacterium]|jgi:hypothetical protein
MNCRAIDWLQREAAELYRYARECPDELHESRIRYQQRAAALSFAARVLAYVESPI